MKNKNPQIEKIAQLLCDKIDESICQHYNCSECPTVQLAKDLYDEKCKFVNDVFSEIESRVIGTIEPSFSQLRDEYLTKTKESCND